MVTVHPVSYEQQNCHCHCDCHLSPLLSLSSACVFVFVPCQDTLRPSLATLEVLVVGAADLKASDSNGKSDPFCVIRFANQEQATHHIPKTLNPKWNTKVRTCLCIKYGRPHLHS